MADMQLVVGGHALPAVVIVEVPVQVLPQAVEAVDLVEDVDAPNVGVWTEAEGFGPLGGLGGVFALVEDVLTADGDRSLGFDALPCSVDFWRWWLAKDGLGVSFNESAVKSFG